MNLIRNSIIFSLLIKLQSKFDREEIKNRVEVDSLETCDQGSVVGGLFFMGYFERHNFFNIEN